jgi:hypothetical protein
MLFKTQSYIEWHREISGKGLFFGLGVSASSESSAKGVYIMDKEQAVKSREVEY